MPSMEGAPVIGKDPILFPNLEMNAEKLVFKPRKPFDVFLSLPHRPNSLPVVSLLRTHLTHGFVNRPCFLTPASRSGLPEQSIYI